MKRIFFTTLLWGIFLPSFLSAKVWINELMQSNIDLVRDDLQDFPDSWIELYNDSNDTVSIQNWVISITSDYQSGWKISNSVTIPPNSYVLIYADKAATGLHTDFRVDSGSGGSLYLFDENGNQIDVVKNIPKQPAPNIAYGRISDGNNSWAYFVTATPLSPNKGKTTTALLPSPIFSQQGGIFKDSVTLKLSMPSSLQNELAPSDLHYTLDNSEPTADSPSYTEEIKISKTTVVRAKLINPNYLSDRSKVQTYIISATDFSLPVISISIDSTYLWDDEFGIYCAGNGKYGVAGYCVDYPVNWNNDWRRPINVEYFPLGAKTSVLNQLCEMRISGGCSRIYPQKSFIIYGNKRFGIKRFDYDLFKDKPNQEIKSFMLRNSGNDFWETHFRDAAIQLFMGGKVNLDYQAYQPAIFYLNGNYWGIQNLRERSNEDFVLANYGLEDIDMIENWSGELKAGDKVAWNQLMNELKKSPSERDYQWIMDQFDIDEYINYMILETYVANTDFPGNNVVMWRPRQTNSKWRFILKDTDFGLGLQNNNPVTHNDLEYNTETDDSSRKLFNALLTQDSFRKEFYSRYAIYMGDLLHYKSTSQIIDSIQQLLEPDIPDHYALWILKIGWGGINYWYDQVALMKDWCSGRNVEVYQQLRDFFQLGSLMQLTYQVEDSLSSAPSVSINGVRMRESGLDASYFQNDTIILHYDGDALPYGWEITRTVNDTTTVNTYFQQDLSVRIPDGCSSMNIKLVANRTGIVPVASSEITLAILNNQLQISNLQLPSLISVYDVSGKLVTKTATSNRSTIISFPQKGIFIVKVQNDTQRLIEKVVKM